MTALAELQDTFLSINTIKADVESITDLFTLIILVTSGCRLYEHFVTDSVL